MTDQDQDNRGVYKFEKRLGRFGVMRGVIVLTAEGAADLQGETIYLYEDFGKHSEFEVELDLQLLTTDPVHVAFVAEHSPLGFDLAGKLRDYADQLWDERYDELREAYHGDDDEEAICALLSSEASDYVNAKRQLWGLK